MFKKQFPLFKKSLVFREVWKFAKLCTVQKKKVNKISMIVELGLSRLNMLICNSCPKSALICDSTEWIPCLTIKEKISPR